MWVPSEDEAVDMFARHFEALHRSGAATKAKREAESLHRSGDHKGHRMWTKVAERIKHLRKERKAALVRIDAAIATVDPAEDEAGSQALI
jgi:hypothetical protein